MGGRRWKPSDASWAIVTTIGVAALAFALVSAVAPIAGRRPPIFDYLLARNEPLAAWLSCVLILASAALARRFPRLGAARAVAALSARPHLFIACVTGMCAAAAVLVYRTHPLSMDEYAPVFQASAFARGHLTGRVPPELVPRLIPSTPWFLEASRSGEMFSTYWPGFALLLTPFAFLRCPWLLNPLIGGATLFVLWHIARKLWPDTAAPGLTVLFAAASPAFVVNAISFYSMPAHLLASMCFVALLLEPTPRRLVLAGALGSVALSLHNPFPHALFAAPFIVSIARQKGRVLALARLAAGYLPGTVLLCGGWVLLRRHLTPPTGGASGSGGGPLHALADMPFALPSAHLLWARSAGLVELALWATPALLPLAWMGARRLREARVPRLLAASALVTLAAYVLVPFDQGHGWGYRYFHSAWGVLPLLAAGFLASIDADAFVRRIAILAAAGSLVFGTAVRFAQVRSFIDGHLAQIPAAASPSRREVVLVRADRGYYSIDLVQNDPFLESGRWTLLSVDPPMDEMFLDSSFSEVRLIAKNEVASVWQIDPAP